MKSLKFKVNNNIVKFYKCIICGQLVMCPDGCEKKKRYCPKHHNKNENERRIEK